MANWEDGSEDQPRAYIRKGEGRGSNTGAMVFLGVLTVLGVGGLAYWVYINTRRLQANMKGLELVHLGSGKMTADGTEQRLFAFEASEPFIFDGWVNLKNMQAGDKVSLKQYVKLGIDKEYGLYESELYGGMQDKPMIFIKPKNALYGMMLTLQQTEGVFREFEWEFYKGVTS